MNDIDIVRAALKRGRTTMNNPPHFLRDALVALNRIEADLARKGSALRDIDADDEGREYVSGGRDQHQDIAAHALAALEGGTK